MDSCKEKKELQKALNEMEEPISELKNICFRYGRVLNPSNLCVVDLIDLVDDLGGLLNQLSSFISRAQSAATHRLVSRMDEIGFATSKAFVLKVPNQLDEEGGAE